MKELFGKQVATFIIVFAMLYLATAQRNFTVELLRLNISVISSNFLKSIAYKVYEHKFISAEFISPVNITEFDAKLKIQITKDDNQRFTLMDFKFKGCDLLRNLYKSNLAKVTMRELFRSSNLPKECPLRADNVYYFHNYTVRAEDYPAWIPGMKFQINLDFYSRGEYGAALNVYGRVRRL